MHGEVDRGAGEQCGQARLWRLVVVRDAPGHHMIEDRSDRIDVGAGVAVGALGLLWRHEREGAHEFAGLCQVDLGGLAGFGQL